MSMGTVPLSIHVAETAPISSRTGNEGNICRKLLAIPIHTAFSGRWYSITDIMTAKNEAVNSIGALHWFTALAPLIIISAIRAVNKKITGSKAIGNGMFLNVLLSFFTLRMLKSADVFGCK